jgi:arylformamidase
VSGAARLQPRRVCARFQETRVEPKVYLDYTQKQLDDAYNQRIWAANAQEVIDRYTTDSAAVRAKYPPRTFRYGPSADETLDWFPTKRPGGQPAGRPLVRYADRARRLPARPGAPVMVFIHGGAWRGLTKEDSAAPAPTFIESGAHYVALNFATIPKVRLPVMAEQCRRAILWVRENARRLGGDPERLYVSGHSSGGHLTGVMLTTDWAALGAPATVLKGGLCASGSFDLEPVMLSARSSYVKLSEDEKVALSPIRHVGRVRCPVTVAYGDRESPEFQRQSRAFADALKAGSTFPSELVVLEGVNHFEVAETMNRPDGTLGHAALKLMGLAAG